MSFVADLGCCCCCEKYSIVSLLKIAGMSLAQMVTTVVTAGMIFFSAEGVNASTTADMTLFCSEDSPSASPLQDSNDSFTRSSV